MKAVSSKSWRYPLGPLLQLGRNPSKEAVKDIVGTLADGQKHWLPPTLKALGDEKRADVAFLVLEILQQSSRMKLDAKDYTMAISACTKGMSWQKACWLFANMADAKVERSVINYSAAMSSCEKGLQWRHALSIFESIPKAGLQYLAVPVVEIAWGVVELSVSSTLVSLVFLEYMQGDFVSQLKDEAMHRQVNQQIKKQCNRIGDRRANR